MDNCQAHGLFEVQAKVFNGAIKIEDKAFESMLESSPLYGGLPLNACYANRWSEVCNFQMPWCLGDGMTAFPVKLFMFARDLTGRFVQDFVFLSRSTQGKAVITVHCHIKGNENN